MQALHPRVAHLRILPGQDSPGHQLLVPPLLPHGQDLEKRRVRPEGRLHVRVDEVFAFGEGVRVERPGSPGPRLVPGRQDRMLDDALLLDVLRLLGDLLPGLGVVALVGRRLVAGRAQDLFVPEQAERAAVIIRQTQVLPIGPGLGALPDPVEHLRHDLLHARQVVDRTDPSRGIPSRRLSPLGAEHVDRRLGHELRLQDGRVLARDRLEVDLLAVLLFEDLGVVGNDLAAPRPEGVG